MAKSRAEQAEYLRNWREKNKDKIRESRKEHARKYHIANREKIGIRHAEWRKVRPELRHKYYLDRKTALVTIKRELKQNGCVVCGYKRCESALVFHHKNPLEKKVTLASYIGVTKLKEEARKCIVLCHNCHSELHAGIISVSIEGA